VGEVAVAVTDAVAGGIGLELMFKSLAGLVGVAVELAWAVAVAVAVAEGVDALAEAGADV